MSAPTLLDLAAKADEMGTPEGDAADKQAEQEQAQTVVLEDSNTKALCVFIALLRAAVCDTPYVFNPPLKSPAMVLADDELPKLCGPWAKVLTHYGLDLSANFDHPVIVAAVSTGPMLWMIGKAIGREISERRPVDTPGQQTQAEPGEPA